MNRDNRHLLVLLGCGFLLVLIAASGPFARTRPTEPYPAGDSSPVPPSHPPYPDSPRLLRQARGPAQADDPRR